MRAAAASPAVGDQGHCGALGDAEDPGDARLIERCRLNMHEGVIPALAVHEVRRSGPECTMHHIAAAGAVAWVLRYYSGRTLFIPNALSGAGARREWDDDADGAHAARRGRDASRTKRKLQPTYKHRGSGQRAACAPSVNRRKEGSGDGSGEPWEPLHRQRCANQQHVMRRV